MDEHSPLGADLQRALAARGREVSLAEARGLALALLGLVRAGLLEPVPDDEPYLEGYRMGALNSQIAPQVETL